MNFVKNGGFTMQIMGIEATNIVVEWGYKGCPQRWRLGKPGGPDLGQFQSSKGYIYSMKPGPLGRLCGGVYHIADILEIEWE